LHIIVDRDQANYTDICVVFELPFWVFGNQSGVKDGVIMRGLFLEIGEGGGKFKGP
jgi:hypothetical protein